MRTKVCCSCKVEKSTDQFYTRHDNRRKTPQINSECKECSYNRASVWRRKKYYGISEDQYIELLDSQNFRCAICLGRIGEDLPKPNTVNVDHCHITGAVRGLLCDKCNMALGLLYDSPLIARRLVQYLEVGGVAQ